MLLADDNPAFLELANRFLDSRPSVEVVGSVGSGQAAVDAVDRLRPDLVLLDLAMPEMSGLDATRLIKAAPDAPQVIIVTLWGSAEYRKAATDVGADGFVTKADLMDRLVPTIREVCPGFEGDIGCDPEGIECGLGQP
jgi:DNA-binding NarL/FixJ family response regulator